MNTSSRKENKSGQSMIMLSVTLASIVLTALALSSFLNAVDLRQVTDTRFSQQAIFSADTGIECALLREFNPSANVGVHCPSAPIGGFVTSVDTPTYMDGVQVGWFRLYLESANPKIYISVGSDLNKRTTRTLQITLTQKS